MDKKGLSLTLFFFAIGCSGGLSKPVSTVSLSSLSLTSISNSTATSDTYLALQGFGYSSVSIDLGSGFSSTNILSDKRFSVEPDSLLAN